MTTKTQSGFTLVELAVVLVIMGLLLGGALTGISMQRENAKYASSGERLDQVKQALLSFVLINKYLPCPDTDADGVENRAGDSSCSSITGAPPYQTLGLTQQDVADSWGNALFYAINAQANTIGSMVDTNAASYFNSLSAPVFNLDTPPTQALASAGDYRVCNQGAATCNAGTAAADIEADQQSVVLVAFNQNGLQTLANCNALDAQEQENCDGDAFFMQRSIITRGAVFFDDQIRTLSGYEVKAVFIKNDPTALQ